MAVEVKCCVYLGDPRVIDKKPTLVKSISCKITESTDNLDPVIYIAYDSDIEKCNYFVIGHKKYFKVKLTNESNIRCRIKLHEDVVSTWVPRVNIKGIIYNSQNYLLTDVDQGFVTEVKHKISRIKISNNYENVTNRPAIIVQSPLQSILQ